MSKVPFHHSRGIVEVIQENPISRPVHRNGIRFHLLQFSLRLFGLFYSALLAINLLSLIYVLLHHTLSQLVHLLLAPAVAWTHEVRPQSLPFSNSCRRLRFCDSTCGVKFLVLLLALLLDIRQKILIFSSSSFRRSLCNGTCGVKDIHRSTHAIRIGDVSITNHLGGQHAFLRRTKVVYSFTEVSQFSSARIVQRFDVIELFLHGIFN